MNKSQTFGSQTGAQPKTKKRQSTAPNRQNAKSTLLPITRVIRLIMKIIYIGGMIYRFYPCGIDVRLTPAIMCLTRVPIFCLWIKRSPLGKSRLLLVCRFLPRPQCPRHRQCVRLLLCLRVLFRCLSETANRRCPHLVPHITKYAVSVTYVSTSTATVWQHRTAFMCSQRLHQFLLSLIPTPSLHLLLGSSSQAAKALKLTK